MKIINHSILGSGLSALIKDRLNKNITIFANKNNNILKSKRFYEYDSFGGNTNIWGAYVNLERFQKFKKNKKFSDFFKKHKIFIIRKYIEDFKNKTGYISNYNSKNIFRIKKNNFKNNIIYENISKIKINKNFIYIFGKKIYKTKSLDLCIGNLAMLDLLYKSKLVSDKDIVSFVDGSCTYTLNLMLDEKRNYYIPMQLHEIFKKLIFKKVDQYYENKNGALVVQKFSKKSKKYHYKVHDLMSYNSNNIRYFLSHHTTNLKINNTPIKIYLKNISKRIKVYNSGIIKKYIPGPISQDIIFNTIVE